MCNQKQTSLNSIEKQLLDILDTVIISQSFCDWAVKWIKNEHKQETQNQNQILSNFEKAVEIAQSKKSRLVDMYMDNLIDKDEFSVKKAEVESVIS